MYPEKLNNFMEYIIIFEYCYQWYPQFLRIEKKNKIFFEDHGSYILQRLPRNGSVIEQDKYTMQCLEYIKRIATYLRSQR